MIPRWLQWHREPNRTDGLAKAEKALDIAKTINHYASQIADEHERIRQENHLGERIARALRPW